MMRASELLRIVIRENIMLAESAITITQAVNDGLALYTGPGRLGGITIVLYDPMQALRSLRASISAMAYRNLEPRDFSPGIVGRLTTIAAPDECDVDDAWAVDTAGARRGHGPLLYDVALSQGHWVVPDRDMVSDLAASVWRHYHEKRPDVMTVQVACAWHGSRPWLDMAYRLRVPVDASALVARHDGAIAAAARVYAARPGWGFERRHYETVLDAAAKAKWSSLAGVS